jgi:hypothetical protein
MLVVGCRTNAQHHCLPDLAMAVRVYKIKRPEIKPIDAFTASLIEADVNENDAEVSKGTRKALLTLM